MALGGEALEEQPALVDRPAGDPYFFAFQIFQAGDVGIWGHHERADRARIGDEGQHLAGGALARDPEKVVDDRVDRLALERHVGRLTAAEALHLELEAALLVEAVMLDHVEFPIDRAELEHAQPDRAQILGRGRKAPDRHQQPEAHCRPASLIEHVCPPCISVVGGPSLPGSRQVEPQQTPLCSVR